MRRDQAHLRRLLERRDVDGFVRALDPLCHREAYRVAPNGLEHDDLIQEARIAVLKVAWAWSPSRGANPLTLAVLAVRRELWKAAGEQNAHKRRINREAVRLDAPVGEAGDVTLAAFVPAGGATIEELAEHRDDVARITRRLARVLPASLLHDVDAGHGRRATLIAHVAGGGHVERDIVYVERGTRRSAISSAGAAMSYAERRHGVVALAASKRKLIDGRERAPQGRPTVDGDLGRAVWRVDVLRPAEDVAVLPAAA